MKNYIVWIALAVLMMTGAFAEGLIEGLPQQLVQLKCVFDGFSEDFQCGLVARW
ncbi:MAG: hypothetical protein BMS9Abin30_0348 [Gammaproteobacteria bacterium]|nr:MAG: hypothetical protein BMS9Abin30_0348 [Gammaproteobacteria bacterium]